MAKSAVVPGVPAAYFEAREVGTAQHASGDDPGALDLARAIAPDPGQPVMLRKPVPGLIGRPGQARDLAVLRRCILESPRLAQAGKPAASALESRPAQYC